MTAGHFDSCGMSMPCECETRRYWLCLSIVLFIFLLEAVGGKVTGSLALVADAGHVLMDSIALVVTLAVTYATRIGMHEERVRKVGGLINSILLGITAVGVFLEAISRIEQPRAIAGFGMMTVAFVGACGNYIQHRILHSVPKNEQHINHKLLDAHVLSDLGLSLTVIVGGGIIILTGNTRWDAFLSLGASCLLLGWAIKLGRDSFRHKQHGDCEHH